MTKLEDLLTEKEKREGENFIEYPINKLYSKWIIHFTKDF